MKVQKLALTESQLPMLLEVIFDERDGGQPLLRQ
jgi:hypothetical protein